MKIKKTFLISLTVLLFGILTVTNGCSGIADDGSKEFTEFMNDFDARFIPLDKKIKLAEYNASITGSKEDYKKAAELNIKLTKIYADKEAYLKLKQIKESGDISDPVQQRLLEEVFNEYKFHQVPEEDMAVMINEAKEIERKFMVYRAELGNKKLTSNQIEAILTTATDSRELEKVWKASKQVGALIADDLIRLVKMRNKAAQTVGFKNYHEMRLTLAGQDPQTIHSIYEDLDILTKHPYKELKYSVDDYLCERYGIKAEDLRPWHYQNQFFQQAPKIYDVDYDTFYKDKNVVEIATNYYKSIGLPIDDVIANSDLYEKPGKSQLGGTYDVDKSGDVRIITNLVDDHLSMSTILYEAGFATYLKNIDKGLPYFLREPSHFLTSDAIAVMFSSLSSNPEWMKEYAGISEEKAEALVEVSKKRIRLEKFIFSRWAQVVYRFEKSMYENPEQDLNKLWWDLVEKYQLIHRPDNRDQPDWATKTHIISMPCQYHNYMIGELYAAQLQTYINQTIAKEGETLAASHYPNIGEFLIEKVYKPGKSKHWEDLISSSTGEPLSANYFKNMYIKVK